MTTNDGRPVKSGGMGASSSLVTRHWSLAAALAVAALAGCGVETATTAATGAAITKQEADQGRKTLEAARQKVEQAAQQLENRSAQDRAAVDK